MSMAWPSISKPASREETESEHHQPRPGRSFRLGRMGYLQAARLQHALMQERRAKRCPDTFLFLEHPPVITLGRGSDEQHVLAGNEALAAAGAEVWETTRGGDVTYHGPGQLVGYGILDLKQHGRDLGLYLRNLEEALIRVLADYGLPASRRWGLTGVWVGEHKVAAIGVRADRWITAHGFALNVEPDLEHFSWIVPCGIRNYGVTSLAVQLRERDPQARVPGLEEVEERVRRHLGDVFAVSFEPSEATQLQTLRLPDEPPLGGVTRLFPVTTAVASESE